MTKRLRDSTPAFLAALLAALLTAILQPIALHAASSARSSALPKHHMRGLAPRYSSATQVIIEAGECRSSSDAVDMSVTSEITVDITGSSGTINGLDSCTLTGGSTFATNSGNATVTATGSAFLTQFGTRTLTGTIGTGGAASTTITGSSSKFLTEVAINDLIGTSAAAYAKVTAIASDTSLTVVSNLTLTNGTTGKVVESPTIQVAAQTAQRVNAIASDTSLTLAANSSATQSSQSAKAGVEIGSCWYALYLLTGTSGAGGYLSTQRTTLFATPSGYTTALRRLGWIKNGATDIVPFVTIGDGITRTFVNDDGGNTHTVVVSSGSGTTWTAADCSNGAPATAGYYWLQVYLFQPSAANELYVRGRNSGSSTASRINGLAAAAASGRGAAYSYVRPDKAGYIEYSLGSASASSANVNVVGWADDPTR